MSSQNNGKKNGSGNTSLNNTPSSTPVTITANSANNQAMHNTNPPNNAPKYGTLVPNRIFVGGISANTTEAELLDLFSKHGTVKAAKIIQDRAGVSKGYGFITFETEEEAKRIQRESDIILKERRLNIAPAIKKQPFSRTYESTSPPSINSAPAQYYLPTNGLPLFSTGVTYYPQPPPPPPPPPGDPNTQQTVYQAQAVYQPPTGPPQTATYPPMVYPTQQIYMPQQFPFPTVPYDYGFYSNGSAPQFVMGNQGAPQHQQPPMQPPGSPTRTSCFNPQLQYAPDTVFFNMPMYGTVEGTPMYSDSMELNNGNMSEDQPSNVFVNNQEAQQIVYQTNSLPPPPLPPSSQSNVSSSPKQSCSFTETSELATNSIQEVNVSRNSATPVVSLLTLEQQQERDYRSMQSGRRQKTVEGGGQGLMGVSDTNNSYNEHHQSNDFMNQHASHNFVQPMLPHNIEDMQFLIHPQPSLPSNPSAALLEQDMPRINNNNNNNNSDRFGYSKYHNKNIDRFNNNNYYQEQVPASFNMNQRHDDSRFNKNTTTPGNFSNRRNNFSASRRGGYNNNNNYHQPNLRKSNYYHNSEFRSKNNGDYYTSRNNNYNVKQGLPSSDSSKKTAENSSITNKEAVVVNSCSNFNGFDSNNSTLLPPQIPIPLSSGGNQNFIPPARKNRRSVRRNTHSGPPLSEIGAGDAPLPSTEVNDACKKLDNLKL